MQTYSLLSLLLALLRLAVHLMAHGASQLARPPDRLHLLIRQGPLCRSAGAHGVDLRHARLGQPALATLA